MKGKRSVWAIVLGLAFLLCPSAGQAADFQWPKMLTIATPAMGSNSYNIDLAWANKLEEGTGMKVRLLPEESTSAKWANVKSGRFDMIQDTMGYIAGWMMEGKEGFQTQQGGPFKARLFWVNQDYCFVIFTRGDSQLKSIYDIPKMGKSCRIIHWTVPAGIDIIKALLAWVNLTVNDVTLVETGSYVASTKMIAEGKGDISVFGVPPSSVFMEAFANPDKLRVLPFDPDKNPEGAKKFRQYLAAYGFPKVVGGPQEFQGMTGWGSPGGFVCRAEMDTELVYNMAKWTVDNFDKIKDLHPFIKAYQGLESNLKFFSEQYFPLHDGVVKYLKEKGVWSEAFEKRQQYNLKVFNGYSEGYKKTLAAAQSKNIPIDPGNAQWVDLWENYKKENKLPRITVLTDKEIEEALKTMK